MIKWSNSARAVALLIFVIGLTAGFLMGLLEGQLYVSVAMVALTGYFIKGSEASRGKYKE